MACLRLDPHTSPVPFVPFSLSLGLLLTLLKWRRTEGHGPAGREGRE